MKPLDTADSIQQRRLSGRVKTFNLTNIIDDRHTDSSVIVSEEGINGNESSRPSYDDVTGVN